MRSVDNAAGPGLWGDSPGPVLLFACYVLAAWLMRLDVVRRQFRGRPFSCAVLGRATVVCRRFCQPARVSPRPRTVARMPNCGTIKDTGLHENLRNSARGRVEFANFCVLERKELDNAERFEKIP